MQVPTNRRVQLKYLKRLSLTGIKPAHQYEDDHNDYLSQAALTVTASFTVPAPSPQASYMHACNYQV